MCQIFIGTNLSVPIPATDTYEKNRTHQPHHHCHHPPGSIVRSLKPNSLPPTSPGFYSENEEAEREMGKGDGEGRLSPHHRRCPHAVPPPSLHRPDKTTSTVSPPSLHHIPDVIAPRRGNDFRSVPLPSPRCDAKHTAAAPC